MLVQKSPKASPGKHLLRGFSICRCGGALPLNGAFVNGE
jgi:hypothetical protein